VHRERRTPQGVRPFEAFYVGTLSVTLHRAEAAAAGGDVALVEVVGDTETWSGLAIQDVRTGQLSPMATEPLTMTKALAVLTWLPPQVRVTLTIDGWPATTGKPTLVPSQATPALVVPWRLTVSSVPALSATPTSTEGVAPLSLVSIELLASVVVPSEA
jgi:hypothetical protein